MSTRPRYSAWRTSASEAVAVRATECSVVGVLIGTLLGGVVVSAKDAAAGGFALLAASLMTFVAVRDARPVPAGQRFTAVLQRDAGAPTMVVDIDLAARRLTVRPLDAAPPAGRAYELWIIDPALGAPRSLGLVPRGGDVTDALKPFDAAVITDATYAVTVEAPGGSPTGRPTTAPVLTGKLSPFPS